MKVLIIGPFPPPVYGVSLSNEVLRTGLRREGHEVMFINTAGSKNIDAKIGKWELSKLKFISTYFKVYKIFSVDIVYITSGQTFYGIIKYAPFVFLAKVLGKKAVVHIKGGYLKESFNKMTLVQQKIAKTVVSSYTLGIVLSKSLVGLLDIFMSRNRIFIQHNFIQETLFDNRLDLKKNKEYDSLRIIFLSNLMQEKGIYELIEALKHLEDLGISYEAKIAGNIPVQEKGLLKKLKKLKKTKYIGVVNGSAKTDLLSWGNLFCLPTFYKMEGQPISIIEAMGFGNVILTTKHAGIPDICNDNNALFVEKKNSKSISDQLLFAFQNPLSIREKGLYNLKEAQSKFTEQSFIEGMTKIFRA